MLKTGTYHTWTTMVPSNSPPCGRSPSIYWKKEWPSSYNGALSSSVFGCGFVCPNKKLPPCCNERKTLPPAVARTLQRPACFRIWSQQEIPFLIVKNANEVGVSLSLCRKYFAREEFRFTPLTAKLISLLSLSARPILFLPHSLLLSLSLSFSLLLSPPLPLPPSAPPPSPPLSFSPSPSLFLLLSHPPFSPSLSFSPSPSLLLLRSPPPFSPSLSSPASLPSHIEWEEPKGPRPEPVSAGNGDNGTDLALEEGDELDSEGRR